jgi:tetratricopeptide (TPR) repeat protein
MAFTHDGMGTALVQKGRLEEAVQQYKIAIEMEPNFSLAHRDLANVYERLGMHEAALLEAQAADNLDKQSGK